MAFLALTGCGGGQPDDGYSGPPPAAYDRGGSAPVLMGSTPSASPADSAGLAGGPASAAMAPIPNPADLTRAERVQYYGHKYDHLPEPKGRKVKTGAASPAYPLIVRRRADGSLEISMRPIANPEDMSAAERRRVYGNRYAPRPSVGWSPRRLWRGDDTPKPVARPAAKAAAAPARSVAVKPAPKPVAAAPASPVVAAAPVARPTAPLKTAPVVAPAAIAPAARPAPTPGEQLSAAVRPEVMKGAVLTVPEGLAKGEESKVSLALPANLMDVIKREAGKLGLGKAARKAEVSASLTGEGYEITPDGAQTQALKAGEAARFDWNVKPGAGDKAPLKATVDGALTGDRKAKTTFSLASLEQAVAPIVEDAKAAAKGFRFPSLSLPELSLKSLAIPGMKPVTLPGVGQVQSEKLVGAGLALLALLLVIAMARSASAGRARAERRRKFRTMQDHGRVEAEPEPAHAPVSQPYFNPMVAAAGGAVAGAAVAHAAHDDHQAHDAHGHESHAPEGHGHAAHPADGHHGDHGHGADHGHGHDAHPVAHHPEPAHGHDDHGHDAHAADSHAPEAHAHDDHGHGDHGHGADHGHGHEAHPVAHHPEPAHGHDDHGHDAHAADSHAPEAHAHDDHGHGDHGHGADHGQGHEAHPVAHHPEPAHGHDDHGHEGHDGHGQDAHGHGEAHADHGHDAHGHHDAHDHHKTPEHA